jgi:outer membrane protein assembly factor BamB
VTGRARPGLLACLVLAALAAPGGAAAGDWAQLGRTANHLNRTSDGALGRGQLASLHVEFTGTYGLNATDEAGPAVAGGVAYIPGADGNVSAFSLTGCGAAQCEPLWTAHTENDITNTPAVDGGVLVVASADRFVYGFPAAGCGHSTCRPLWQVQLGDAVIDSSVAVDRGVAYVGGYDGHLYAVSVQGCGQALCAPLWVGRASDGHLVSPPAVGDHRVFVADDRGTLSAFPANGCGAPLCDPEWQGKLGGPTSGNGPTVYRHQVIIGSGTNFGGHSGPHVEAFATAGCGQSHCKPVWRGDIDGESVLGTPAVSGHTLYVASQFSLRPFETEGVVTAFDLRGCGASLCQPLWTAVNFASGFESSPVVVDGMLYVAKGPASGFPVDVGVFAYDARGCGDEVCLPLGFVQVAESAFYLGSPIAVSNGRLLFGANDNDEGGASKLYVLSTAATP